MSMLRRATRGGVAIPHLRSYAEGANPWVIPSNSAPAFTSAGVNVSEETAMQLLSVYACVRLLCGTVSGLPLQCVEMVGSQRKAVDPAPLIIADPFGGANVLSGVGLTRKQGIAQLMMSLLLRGNAFCFVVQSDAAQRPQLLQVLHPDAVDVTVDRETAKRTYKVNHKPVPQNRILHILGLTQPGYPIGISVVGAAQRAISLGIAAEEYGARFFGSGAHLSGVIETESDMDPDKARTLAENFQAMHGGIAKAHKVGVLTGGAKWAPISVAPEDAQFLGTRAAQNLDIAMLFGIPPHMLGQVDRTTSWGKGIEEQTMGFLKFTLADWAQKFEDAFTAMLPDPELARFDYEELLRPDVSTRWSYYQIARNVGALTVNEVRAKEGMAPLPGDLGDDPFASLNSAHTNDPGWTPDGEEGGTPPPAPEPVPQPANGPGAKSPRPKLVKLPAKAAAK